MVIIYYHFQLYNINNYLTEIIIIIKTGKTEMFHDYTGDLLKTEYAYGYSAFLNPRL